jgi:aminopeptidase N
MQSPAPAPDQAVQTRKRLAEYRPPDWLVPDIRLRFELAADRTLVHAQFTVRRNGAHTRPLVLDGDGLQLLGLRVDGVSRPIPNPGPEGLVLDLRADETSIETTVAIRPAENSRLMGLYSSGGNLCTQCEAEGFRRITFFPDRPDILTRYQVRLEANAQEFPVLLANGNPQATGELPGGRHYAEWEDPHPKPCYLFALVAGRLTPLRDSFTTASGRRVDLAIWVAPADVPRCRHAMDSLKASMAWDERVYGREYDLDMFNIVAVHDFNFGAMENKGLNIFNAKYVLADPDTATDWDYDAIAAIVAHEYFHNWSGNRVTCRDWFQLSLKEGFTVYRDQQFSADMGSPAVRRIEGVRSLRSGQFPEDEGPLAHPVRPDSYAEINNFYTATVYDKGAELIRMMARQLGPERFRAGTDRYFDANDGTAATVEDFLDALATQGLDAPLFKRWYEQPGTPRVDVEALHDPAAAALHLRLIQSNPRAGEEAPPLPIPMPFALFDAQGLKLHQSDTLLLTERDAVVTIGNCPRPPILSLNRGFASPVIVRPAPSRADLLVLAAHEDDPFARYEAVQQLMLSALVETATSGTTRGHADVLTAVDALLASAMEDPAFAAETLLLPGEALIGDQLPSVDPEAVHSAREDLRRAICTAHADRLWAAWHACDARGDDRSPRAKGLRRLRGILLFLLLATDDHAATAAAFLQFTDADCMTDRMSALTALSHSRSVERDEALKLFEQRYADFPEVLDKWFLVQAASTRSDTRAVVERLAGHARFDRRNPNRLRALVLGFAMNQTRFHDRAGAGYALLAAHVLEADRINPQSAARLVQPLARWRRFARPWGPAMRQTLERIAATPGLSRDLAEVTTTSLS